jgi:hypothetical protein
LQPHGALCWLRAARCRPQQVLLLLVLLLLLLRRRQQLQFVALGVLERSPHRSLLAGLRLCWSAGQHCCCR